MRFKRSFRSRFGFTRMSFMREASGGEPGASMRSSFFFSSQTYPLSYENNLCEENCRGVSTGADGIGLVLAQQQQQRKDVSNMRFIQKILLEPVVVEHLRELVIRTRCNTSLNRQFLLRTTAANYKMSPLSSSFCFCSQLCAPLNLLLLIISSLS